MNTNPPISDFRKRCAEQLLAQRNAVGHWEGELSSSALSTATASFALSLVGGHDQLVARGLKWLAENQNEDGGWGDTVLSNSNISTTVLCWSALGERESLKPTRDRAEAWLAAQAGGTTPDQLVRAIEGRYQTDRTFSIPILTMAALAGKLGDDGWRRVQQLPFELAAMPQSFYRWLQLPVVSYALPALIAVGQCRHGNAPTRNPLMRLLRNLLTPRTLKTLRQIQPTTGGYLEATPLTSFVTMSLVGRWGGQILSERQGASRRSSRATPDSTEPVASAIPLTGFPNDAQSVVDECVRFLVGSVRPDGSWPIDTNLATWVTTLSVNALSAGGRLYEYLCATDREQILDWLLAQQYRQRHPYTGAPPGGWAWTDLPGGVPDADDTAGALIALKHLGHDPAENLEPIELGLNWLLNLQNRDGGMPTFCRGWGRFPFDRSSTDITAHALRAFDAWHNSVPDALQRRIDRAKRAAVQFLTNRQREDGSWLPLWFGNQHQAEEDNPTHGTSRVLRGFDQAAAISPVVPHGQRWLLSVQNEDGGFGGDVGLPSTIEETALAVDALANRDASDEISGACQWLADRTGGGTTFPPSPIGFYFAKLWYFEKLYPLVFTVAALERADSG
jgi:squalene-hopene/tetraprenyl-beta-curcumene cyclase